jgi:hypothetical protein
VHCGREESVEHCLLFCQFASEVWSHVKKCFDIHLCRRNFRSPKQWLFDFIDRASMQQSTVLAIMVWHIWEARNAVRNEEGNTHPHVVASKIQAYVNLVLLHLYKTVTVHSRETTSSSAKWSPPQPGSVLVNVDAAVFSNLHKVGVGILIRNHEGECLVAHSRGSYRQNLRKAGRSVVLQLLPAMKDLPLSCLLQTVSPWFNESIHQPMTDLKWVQ